MPKGHGTTEAIPTMDATALLPPSPEPHVTIKPHSPRTLLLMATMASGEGNRTGIVYRGNSRGHTAK